MTASKGCHNCKFRMESLCMRWPAPMRLADDHPRWCGEYAVVRKQPAKRGGGSQQQSFMQPYIQLWRNHMGGLLPYGRSAGPIKELEDMHSPEVVQRAFEAYLLAEKDSEFCSVAQFATKFGQYNRGPKVEKAKVVEGIGC